MADDRPDMSPPPADTARSVPQVRLRAALEECGPAVRRYLFGLCGDWDQAEDIAQEAMLRAWQRQGDFDGRSDARTWVFAIARNYWIDGLRRSRTSRQEPMPENQAQYAADHRTAPAILAGREFDQAVRKALDLLPPEQREALALRESEGLSFPQIAQMLGMPVATVKSRVRYALLKLADELEQFRPE